MSLVNGVRWLSMFETVECCELDDQKGAPPKLIIGQRYKIVRMRTDRWDEHGRDLIEVEPIGPNGERGSWIGPFLQRRFKPVTP